MLGDFATALAGSSDTWPPPATRTVNFIAAHDGFTLADLTAHRHKHNQANGEHNRDGHGENLSWNNGVEGATSDPAVRAARRRDQRALLATLFAARGSIMLTAGDEFGRTQAGNNNAYAQDNPLAWLDWTGRDRELEAYTASLAALRRAHPGARRPPAPHRRPRPRRHPRRRLAHPRRPPQDPRGLAERPRPRPRHGPRRAAETAASPSSSTAAPTPSPSTSPPAPATPGPRPRRAA